MSDILKHELTQTIAHFEAFEFESGVNKLIDLRQTYADNSSFITELYNSCVNVLIKNCVKTAFNYVSVKHNLTLDSDIIDGKWVVASSAARIDLQVFFN